MKILGIETSCDETAAAVVELIDHGQATKAEVPQGADEQRTAAYTQYGKGVAESATPRHPASASGVAGSAGQQAGAVCRLLSNVVSSSMDLHAQYGGVVPEIAARSHIEVILPVINQALEEALGSQKSKGEGQKSKVKSPKHSALDIRHSTTERHSTAELWDQIDGIAVTYGAGLGGSLLIGVMTARTLAIAHNKPLYAINHVEGHVYANFLTELGPALRHSERSEESRSFGKPQDDGKGYKMRRKQPEFPMLAIIVSGGHSQLALFRDHFDYTLLGQTQDDAIGEAFDKVAKILGLPYPGGPSVAKAAENGDPQAFQLPKAKMGKYDFSFSGLKTAVLRLAQAQIGESYDFPSTKLSERLSEAQKADIAASFQYTAVQTIVDKVKLACEEFQPKSVVIAGGVAANQELRRQLTEAIPLPLEYPDMKLCTDNGAMIATLGCFHALHERPQADPYSLEIQPNLSM